MRTRASMEANDRGGPASDLTDEKDADLLTFMTMADEDPAVARAAWEAFYRRHAAYVYGVCVRAYAKILGGEAGVCDLVADTFKRAYEHAETFEAGGITDPERMRLRTRAWLGRIAERLAQTRLRGRKRLPTRTLELGHWQEIGERPVRTQEDAGRIERVRAAILSLSEKERVVIRATFQWYDPGVRHQRLPNEVAAELARTLRTTPENLRQIRRRALVKIKKTLVEHADDGAAMQSGE